jgi:hypothetical protein
VEAPSHRVTISIDDHMPKVSAVSPESCGFEDLNLSQCLKTKGDENPTTLLMLKTCLQQLGIDQIKSEQVIQNFKVCLDGAVDKSAKLTIEACCDAQIPKKASQRREKNNKPLSHGGSEAITMMICNIPCRASEDEIMLAIDSFGFAGTYKHVQLSRRHGQVDSNLGYGFVHFYRQADAARFAHAFEGYRFNQRGSSKACTVKVANSQARNAKHIANCDNSKVRQLLRASP